jgi:thioredoxin-related protein
MIKGPKKMCKGITFGFFLCVLFSCETRQKNKRIVITVDKIVLERIIKNEGRMGDTIRIKELQEILRNYSADSVAFKEAVSFLGKHFWNPNSDYRNEFLTKTVLNEQIVSPWYSEMEKHNYKKELKLLQQNSVGNAANDFTYYIPEGKAKRLYDIEAKYLLLFFYNPECEACKEMKESLMKSAIIQQQIKTKQLKVLAVYTDKDETVWRKHLPEMPITWLNGRDENEFVWKNRVYDLRAIPSVYLLDKEKRVLLKDCMDVSKIEETLMGNEQ